MKGKFVNKQNVQLKLKFQKNHPNSSIFLRPRGYPHIGRVKQNTRTSINIGPLFCSKLSE
ncbi:hypothetical protein H5410_022972 [Solanum commersonii]|uniref:Uncharacterized protein n=1 Tax=Solanum commersonii TaxID=4109 RepID=A0A9J5ZFJ6_SOLCO|nr:hypothetical protein H5410_022972 [Solanum commersonii]